MFNKFHLTCSKIKFKVNIFLFFVYLEYSMYIYLYRKIILTKFNLSTIFINETRLVLFKFMFSWINNVILQANNTEFNNDQTYDWLLLNCFYRKSTSSILNKINRKFCSLCIIYLWSYIMLNYMAYKDLSLLENILV